MRLRGRIRVTGGAGEVRRQCKLRRCERASLRSGEVSRLPCLLASVTLLSLSASIHKRNANREPLNGDRGVQIFVEVAGTILPFLPPIDYLILNVKSC